MASTYTNNFELEKQGVGDNVDTWGDPTLNTNVIQRIDDALGKTTEVALVSSNVSLTQSQWRSKAFLLTGTISANIAISLPLSINSVGSATAVGGEFVVDNQTTGAFTVTIKTLATGSTGVEVPQGYRSTLYSDTVDVLFADDQARSSVLTYAGDPNGNVAGTAGSSTTPASMRWDRTNSRFYLCTTAGVAADAVWLPVTGATQPPQGYLTTNSSLVDVVQAGDATGATTIYYSPFTGAFCPVWNGSTHIQIPFAQLSLALSASQAAAGIYDVIFFLDSGTARIGFGPSWSAGSGGSVTAGSCARGTGAGGAAMQRINGIFHNTAAMTVTNGASSYAVAALRGTVLGSVFIDSTQGQVTCTRTIGQNRKWGISNIYNQQPITLTVADPTTSWSYTGGFRVSRGDATNKAVPFFSVPYGGVNATFNQCLIGGSSSVFIGIGWNAVNGGSGKLGFTASGLGVDMSAVYTAPPFLGIADVSCVESATSGGTYAGTSGRMGLTLTYMG